MRRSFLYIVLSILSTAGATAGENYNAGRFHFGLEWGYGQGIYSYSHINIISQEGYRINETSRGFWRKSNGEILAKIGYDLHEKVNLSLCAGWTGISEDCQAYPLLLRIGFAPKGLYNEGFFTFIDGGIGFRAEIEEYSKAVLPILDAGEGYRLWLAPNFFLDFMLSIRTAFDSPLIRNPEGPGIVKKENIRHNVAEFYSVNISIALSF